MTGSEQIDEAIRAYLEHEEAPRTMEEICQHVADEVGCRLTEVERRVVALPDVEQGGRLWRLEGVDDE